MAVERLGSFAWALLVLAGATAPAHSSQARQDPVIDMHVHSMQRTLTEPILACPGNQPIVFPAVDPAKPVRESDLVRCARPIASALGPVELRDRTIAELKRHNVRRAVVIAPLDALPAWHSRAPGMIIPAALPARPDPAELNKFKAAHAAGKISILAEFGSQYAGKRTDDPQFEPFWALAEELDVPVGVHLGEGMPLQAEVGSADRYRVGLTSPFQLEEVIRRHPRLRIYVMHAASPLIDEMIAMLFTYPSLYVDVAANDWNMPRAQFYDELRRLVDAGFGERILFGSDQTLFPQAIGLAINTIKDAPFLTSEQKRNILYNNAARFLRLTPEQIAADHR